MMFKLSKKTEYGILALQHMASLNGSRVATVKEIAETHRVPQSLLAKILQQLAKSKIIQSVQGSRGGYTLSRDAKEISLADVLEAIEGPLSIVECTLENHRCERDEFCTLKDSLNPIQQHLSTYFNSVTLADFARAAQI